MLILVAAHCRINSLYELFATYWSRGLYYPRLIFSISWFSYMHALILTFNRKTVDSSVIWTRTLLGTVCRSISRAISPVYTITFWARYGLHLERCHFFSAWRCTFTLIFLPCRFKNWHRTEHGCHPYCAHWFVPLRGTTERLHLRESWHGVFCSARQG